MKKLILFLIALMLVSSVSALDYWHGETCDRADGIPVNARFLNKPFWSISAYNEDQVEFRVEIEALDKSGYAVCEVGIYYEDVVKSWYGGNILYSVGAWDSLTGNCVEGQNFLITKRVYLKAGDKKEVDYSVFVPKHYDPNERFTAHLNCFNHCYLCSHEDYEGYSSDFIRVDVKERNYNPTSNHCSNFQTDKDETDLDCGGDKCQSCVNGMRCKKDSDCKDNNCNSEFMCGADKTSGGGEPKPGNEFTEIPVEYIIGGLVVIVLLIVGLALSKK